jgi:hypothetical protein
VLAEVRERWRRLPPPARARIHLACLPLTSPDENDAMVNAIQRPAAVVVSLQEGFGLGVTEAMWKARPVVASAVGGCERRAWHRQGWTPSTSVRHLRVRTGLECRDRDRATCDLDRTRLPAQRARLRGRGSTASPRRPARRATPPQRRGDRCRRNPALRSVARPTPALISPRASGARDGEVPRVRWSDGVLAVTFSASCSTCSWGCSYAWGVRLGARQVFCFLAGPAEHWSALLPAMTCLSR